MKFIQFIENGNINSYIEVILMFRETYGIECFWLGNCGTAKEKQKRKTKQDFLVLLNWLEICSFYDFFKQSMMPKK